MQRFGTTSEREFLPSPQLDDLAFQPLMDRARPLIARYCPEWTDHNLSDPGITLLELFAHLVDMMSYRLNQVPDKMYIKFLEMLGTRLESAKPAQADITFYLSSPAQAATPPIPKGVEVSTRRLEGQPAIGFRLKKELVLEPVQLTAVISHAGKRGTFHDWIHPDIPPLQAHERIEVFGRSPTLGDALLFGFHKPIGARILELHVRCGPELPHELDPSNPPLQWEVRGKEGPLLCLVMSDTTRGFVDSGAIKLQIPECEPEPDVQGVVDHWWLTCRYIHKEGSRYATSPMIRIERVDVVGGTVPAAHEELVENELLGRSDGSPGQEFQLRHFPLLEREEGETLLLELPYGELEEWVERRDFSMSSPDDRHFVLDSNSGRLLLPPILPTPEGKMYQFGRIPPQGAILRFSRYRHGGGARGNVVADTLVVLKRSVPYIARVTNHQAATGGRDLETLEHARLRTLKTLGSRDRAVTAEDYVFLAQQLEGVARACCTGAGPVGQEAAYDMQGGMIWVRILPRLAAGATPNDLNAYYLSSAWNDLRARVQHYLSRLSVIGVQVSVAQVILVPIRVEVAYSPAVRGFGQLEALESTIRSQVASFLDPFSGGNSQQGWPFGRPILNAEVRGCVERIPGVEFADVRVTSGVQPDRVTGLAAATRAGVQIHRWALPLLMQDSADLSVHAEPQVGR